MTREELLTMAEAVEKQTEKLRLMGMRNTPLESNERAKSMAEHRIEYDVLWELQKQYREAFDAFTKSLSCGLNDV